MTRWKAIGWTVAFFVVGVVAALATGMLVARITGMDPRELWFQVIVQTAGFLVATWVLAKFALKWDLKDLRWRGSGESARTIGLGLLLGVVPAIIAMAVAAPASHLAAMFRVVPEGFAGWSLDGGTFGAWGGAVGKEGLQLLPAAFSEELIFRGVAFVALARAFGPWKAAAGLSVLFAAAHLGNPEVSWLALVNVALAGVWLSGAFLLRGGIWTATAAHLGWNFTLMALGAPVSGLAFALPMLDYSTGGPRWLTGGAFGPEGGVIATVVVGTMTWLVYKRVAQENAIGSWLLVDREMSASQERSTNSQ